MSALSDTTYAKNAYHKWLMQFVLLDKFWKNFLMVEIRGNKIF